MTSTDGVGVVGQRPEFRALLPVDELEVEMTDIGHGGHRSERRFGRRTALSTARISLCGTHRRTTATPTDVVRLLCVLVPVGRAAR